MKTLLLLVLIVSALSLKKKKAPLSIPPPEGRVYASVYITDGSPAGISQDMEDLLGLHVKNSKGYYPVGVITLPKTLFTGKQSPYLKEENDWNEVVESMSVINKSLLNKDGRQNINNTVGNHMDCVQVDYGYKAGSYHTALVDWFSGEDSQMIKQAYGNYRYHLDLFFATRVLSFTSVKRIEGGVPVVGEQGDLGSRKYLQSIKTIKPGLSKDFYLTLSEEDKKDYSIEGYYEDPELTTLFKFGTPLDTNLTIYVSLVKQALYVTYDLNEGKTDSVEGTWTSPDLSLGDKFPILDDIDTIKREGYEFIGWADNEEEIIYEKVEDFPKQVTKTVTLTAVWKKLEPLEPALYVTYDLNGGKTDSVEGTWTSPDLSLGDKFPILDDIDTIKKDGYELFGWEDIDGDIYYEKVEDFPKQVTKTVTLTAIWGRLAPPFYPPEPDPIPTPAPNQTEPEPPKPDTKKCPEIIGYIPIVAGDSNCPTNLCKSS